MSESYIKLAEKQLSSTATTITFNNIPQNYSHLVIKSKTKLTIANSGSLAAFRVNQNSNSTTGDLYFYYDMSNLLLAAGSFFGYIHLEPPDNSTTVRVKHSETIIFDYSKTDRFKNIISTQSDGCNLVGGYNSTSAITRLDFIVISSSSSIFDSGTIVSLYGVR